MRKEHKNPKGGLTAWFGKGPKGDWVDIGAPKKKGKFQACGRSKLAKDKKILASVAEMQKDIRMGKRGDYEPGDYYHNIIIGRLFDKTRQQAWLNIRKEDIVEDLIREEDIKTLERRRKTSDTNNLLAMYK